MKNKVRSIWLIFLLVMLLTGCVRKDRKEDQGKMEECPVLNIVTLGKEPECGMKELYEQLDILTKEELGCVVRFTFVSWNDASTQMPRLIASKTYDIYCCGGFMDYEDFAARHAFLELDDFLKDYPALTEHYRQLDENILETSRTDGKLYGIPQIVKNGDSGNGFLYREDLREKWGLEPVEDFNSMEVYLYRAAREYPNTAMINDSRYFQVIRECLMENKYSVIDNYCVIAREEPEKVLSIYETEEYLQALRIANKWYNDGIVEKDILMGPDNSTDRTKQLMLADQKPLEFSNHLQAVNNYYILPLSQKYSDQKYGWMDYSLYGDNYYLPEYQAGATMANISSSSSQVELALKLLEKAHTDQRYYDLFSYGVPGIHYHLTEEGNISYEGIAEENTFAGWIGIRDSAMERKRDMPEYWQELLDRHTKDCSEQAQNNGRDELSNFSYSESKAAYDDSVRKNLQEVYEQYLRLLEMGISENPQEELEDALVRMREAGLETYLEDVQRQLNEWRKRK